MIPTEPDKMNGFFADAYNSGDATRLNALFEKNARIVQYNGEVISGFDKMNAEHLNLLKFGGKMTSINKYCVQIEDIALLRADWKIEFVDEKNETQVIEGSSTEIVRKQPVGTWLYIVDNPFGANK